MAPTATLLRITRKRHVPHGAFHFYRRQPVRLLGGLRCGVFTVRVGLARNALDLAYGNPIKLEAPVSSEHQMMPEIPMPQIARVAAKSECPSSPNGGRSTNVTEARLDHCVRWRADYRSLRGLAADGGPRDAMGQAARRWHHRRCVNRWSAPMPQPNDPGLRRGRL
jgi:hypothetical protein